MIEHYGLKSGDSVLDIGCGKGFQMVELMKALPGLKVRGLDISTYAIENAHPDVKSLIDHGSSDRLPYADQEFDFVFSITTLHNLHNQELEKSLREIERVGKKKYICVESYRTEAEKANLLYWQVTCEQFNSPDDWDWWFNMTGYSGDHSFIFFE